MSRLVVPVDDRDHARGRGTVATLVEYGDYQCPHCGQAHLVVQQLAQELGDGLAFVFRNFPLSQVHPHALLAAEAAEVVGQIGDFWVMHDLLYENQDSLGPDDLRVYAERAGADPDDFDRLIAEHAGRERVISDFRGGVRSGVNGTPTFFINGERHDGGYDFDSLVQGITRAVGPA